MDFKALTDYRTRAEQQVDGLISRIPELAVCRDDIMEAYFAVKESFDDGGKLLVFGNGGSCADAEHITGELMKGFVRKRRITGALRDAIAAIPSGDGEKMLSKLELGFPVIPLTSHTGLISAYANDEDAELIYAQQVLGYGRPEDTVLGITTSGNSRNVCLGLELAKAMGLKTLLLTGKDGGTAKKIADISIVVPSNETYRIQEYHLPVYHALCRMLEDTYFTE